VLRIAKVDAAPALFAELKHNNVDIPGVSKKSIGV
jgi:hypothetical protein